MNPSPLHPTGALPPRLFLLDDDPIFCKLMSKVAKKRGIPLAICSRLVDFGIHPSHRNFDVALIDYYLEDLTGSDVACLLEDRPVILVSRSDSETLDNRSWPECIKGFLKKSQGPEAILDAALALGSRMNGVISSSQEEEVQEELNERIFGE